MEKKKYESYLKIVRIDRSWQSMFMHANENRSSVLAFVLSVAGRVQICLPYIENSNVVNICVLQ